MHPLLVSLTLLPTAQAFAPGALHIAAAQNVIEHTPLILAAQDYYSANFTIENGGVANIASLNSSTAKKIDLAANAETQGLRQYYNNRSLRLLMVVVESTYRIVARNLTGEIKSISDLRGKKVLSIPLTSAGYFVEKFLLAKAGLSPGTDYTPYYNNASICLREPCSSGSFSGFMGSGVVDAVGMWEPISELSVRAVGGRSKVAVFSDKKVYREVYSLWTVQAKLDDPERRSSIVEYVRGLLRMQETYQKEPKKVIKRASEVVNVTEEILEAVWEDHYWKGYLPTDLVDFMTEEDKYLARMENRTALPREEIAKMVEPSVLEEALKAEGLTANTKVD